MSMYNLMFGENPISDLILGMLRLNRSDVGRFRDAFVSNGEIAIYTRNGGSNRDCWNDDKEIHDSDKCDCTGCIMTHRLPKHPNYIRDEDGDFDCTYATIYFSIPDKFKELAKLIETGEFNSNKRWMEKLDEIKALNKDTLKEKYPELCNIVEEIADNLSK